MTREPCDNRFGEALFRGFWTTVFAYISVVEWGHFRRALAKGDLVEMWGTCTAAVAAGFMASEALEGRWP